LEGGERTSFSFQLLRADTALRAQRDWVALWFEETVLFSQAEIYSVADDKTLKPAQVVVEVVIDELATPSD
jgi:hypothetical protein